MTFTRSKIQPPRFRVGLIERSGLEHLLGAALLSRRLVLIVAPAGYGKTAALSRQLAKLPPGVATAWVTADKEDDLPRLLDCLTEALEPHDPPWRVAPEALAGQLAQDEGLRRTVDELVNALGAMPLERGVLAIDDLHCVADRRVFEFLGLLLDSLPDGWTVALASRVIPPFALARLRARRELAQFGQAELSFGPDEVRRLCDPVQVDDDVELARRVYDRTQGWPAGVSLSLDAVVGGRAVGHVGARMSQRHLFDYLASEVFDQMSVELRQFLMRCSVLPELVADRCAAVSGNPLAADLLEDIEGRGLFVSVLDGEELTLRLHDLFRDFLADRLMREEPDALPWLLRRAAEGERDPVRKVNLLLRAGAWPEAEQVFTDTAMPMLAMGDSTQVARLIEQFPTGMREQSPQLDYVEGLCFWQQHGHEAMGRVMGRAAAGFERQQRTREAQHARAFEAISLFINGRASEVASPLPSTQVQSSDTTSAALGSLVRLWQSAIHGPPSGPGTHLAELVRILNDGAPPGLWFCCMTAIYGFIGRPGVLPAMENFARGALVASGETHPALRAAARMLEAWPHLWQGRLDAAREAIKQLREDSQWLGQPRSLREPLVRALAIHDAMRGDREQARLSYHVLAADGDGHVRGLDLNMRVFNLGLAARLAACVEDWDFVRDTQQKLDDMLAGDEGSVRCAGTAQLRRPVACSVKARLAMHDGRADEAVMLLREVVKVSANFDRMGVDVCARIYLALAELRAGSAQAAWQVLAPVIAQVAESGEVGGVLLGGLSVLTELAEAPWGCEAAAPQIATLRSWAEVARALRTGAPRVEDAEHVQELLSPREFEVLDRILAGDSNKVIARALSLSPHTVKRHVARILDRLNVSSRVQAAVWYQNRRSSVKVAQTE